MRKLKDDSINLWRGVIRAERPRARLALPALMLVALALIVLSRLDHSAIRAARLHLGSALAPLLSALTAPVAPLREAGREIGALIARADMLDRLEARNRELEGWRWKAEQLERELAELKRQTATVTGSEPASLTTRVIADASGIFVRSALIDAGREQGIRPGHPVVTVDGLVGRIVEAGRRTSSVLLVTDVNARVPVAIGRDGVRAVMVGDNGSEPHLAFMGGGSVSDGDLVTTSGAGGLFPPGLRVGRIVRVGATWRVAPAARLDALSYVRVLLYDSDTLRLADDRPAQQGLRDAPPPPRQTTDKRSEPRPLAQSGVEVPASGGGRRAEATR